MIKKENLTPGDYYYIEIFPCDFCKALWNGSYFRLISEDEGLNGDLIHYDDALDIKPAGQRNDQPDTKDLLIYSSTIWPNTPKNPPIDGAIKYDEDKPRPELIPPEMIDALGYVLAFGAQKYEDRNWEKGMAWSRCFGALQRHLWAWWNREEGDPETGMSHLWHAACCLSFLVAYEERGIGEDDRA